MSKPTTRQALDKCVEVLLDAVYAGFTQDTWQAWIAKRGEAILMAHEATDDQPREGD